MWRKWNPCALLVRMQTGAATVESSMEFPQKIKNGLGSFVKVKHNIAHLGMLVRSCSNCWSVTASL